jgi:hypothetical protein
MRGFLLKCGLLVAAAQAATVAAPVGASAGLLDYVGQCVPFARAASGIEIYGDAWTWWNQADGRYERGHRPRAGSVIVFAKTARLPLGHVAVVSRVVEHRVLMLTHANWSRQNGKRGHAEQDVTLYDVSRDNDWSEVKVWYRDAEGLGGGIYPVKGFIYGGHPSSQLTSRNPDYVGALIDAYVPDAGR